MNLKSVFKKAIHVVGDIQLTENFRLSEFVCKEGKNEVKVDMRLVYLLQDIRDDKEVNKPVRVVSGWRSVFWNLKCGGSPKSRHLKGEAADIKVRGMSPLQLAKIAERHGADGIGIYPKWLHVDVRGYKARWGAILTSKEYSKGKLDYTVAKIDKVDDYSTDLKDYGIMV